MKVQDLKAYQTVNNSEPRTSPGTATPDQVAAAKEVLAHQGEPALEIITEGQKIVLQVEKLVTEQLVNVTKRIIGAVDLDAAATQEADTLVSETDVSGPVSKATPQATRLAGELRAKKTICGCP
jgi:CO dehydrogenase/acetyl-CoA synthase epsilon subunit